MTEKINLPEGLGQVKGKKTLGEIIQSWKAVLHIK